MHQILYGYAFFNSLGYIVIIDSTDTKFSFLSKAKTKSSQLLPLVFVQASLEKGTKTFLSYT